MNDYSHNNLWLYRRRRGFPQKWVALLLGHSSPSVVSEYERGIKTPPLSVALKLQVIFGAPLAELFPGLQSIASEEVEVIRQKCPYIAEREKSLLPDTQPASV
jgi:transcriptional regulator with XRE-family HTH domain